MRQALYFILFEGLLCLIYLYLFGLGYYSSQKEIFIVAGIGLTLYITISTFSEPKKLLSFFVVGAIISLITAFFGNWYKGLFWVSAITSIGQIPGLLVILFNYNKLAEENNFKTKTSSHLISILFLSTPLIFKILFF